jgi:geranylgeranyl diphosphate synthase type II
MTVQVPDCLASRARLVDDVLSRLAPPAAKPPEAVHRAMRYTLLAPSKRVRAVITLLCADLCGAEQLAMPAAAAIEMIHASSLILDDLPAMDDAALRRGRVANHREFGEGMAILASVGLLNLAFGTVAGSYDPPLAQRLTLLLARAIGSDGLIGGQADDLLAQDRQLPLSRLEHIHRRKTAVLFSASARAGAAAAGADDELTALVETYAELLGLAFQIVDDLLVADDEVSPFETDADRTEARQRALDLSRQGIRALAPLGERATHLRALAAYIVDRNE